MIEKHSICNLTVMVADSGGLSSFANLVVYLNKTSLVKFEQNPQFCCSINGLRTELNQTNLRTLEPRLFIQVSINIHLNTVNLPILGE